MSKAADKRRERLRRGVVRMLKALREDADLSRAQLAKRLDWPASRIVNLENERRRVYATDLIEIAEALQVDVGELVRKIQRW